jgi:hypothetical protein
VEPNSGTRSLTKARSPNHSPAGPVLVASHSPSQLHTAPAVAPPWPLTARQPLQRSRAKCRNGWPAQMALISRAGEGRRPKSTHDTPHLWELRYRDSGIRGKSTFCRDEPVSPIPGVPRAHHIASRPEHWGSRSCLSQTGVRGCCVSAARPLFCFAGPVSRVCFLHAV